MTVSNTLTFVGSDGITLPREQWDAKCAEVDRLRSVLLLIDRTFSRIQATDEELRVFIALDAALAGESV